METCKVSDNSPASVLNAYNNVVNAEAASAGLDSSQGERKSINTEDQVFDLASVVANGIPLRLSGTRLLYRRVGSAPGGKLNVDFGGRVRSFYPGCVITAPFNGGLITREPDSSNVGPVFLTAIKDFRTDLVEPSEGPAPLITPAVLLGTVTGAQPALVKTYVQVAVDTLPTGTSAALQTGAFNITGVSRIRVLLDTLNGAAVATNFTLAPYFTEGDAVWYNNEIQSVTVSDTLLTAGRRYRVVELAVSGNGWLILVPSGVGSDGAAITTMGMIVEGVA